MVCPAQGYAYLLLTLFTRYSSVAKNTPGMYIFHICYPLILHMLISETCIKGHRSSACKHTDRPLFEIKKKGRPVTQCEHCRELRKTKQVHVKCICELSSDNSTESLSVRKGVFHLNIIISLRSAHS